VLDPYQDRKAIHINLKKETYVEVRKHLFSKGISLQEFFDKCAEELVRDSRFSLNSILERLVLDKTKKEMEKSKFKERKRIDRKLSELDVNTLYSLIGEQSETDKR